MVPRNFLSRIEKCYAFQLSETQFEQWLERETPSLIYVLGHAMHNQRIMRFGSLEIVVELIL